MKKLDKKIINYDFYKQNLKDNYYVYLHLTLDEDIPFYVGKGKNQRCKNHLHRSEWWNNIVNKHDYYIKILDINLTEEEAFSKEIEYINKYGRKQFGNGGTLINLTDGGEGSAGKIYTEEEKQKISEKYKNNPNIWSNGTIGIPKYGEENPNYGNTGESNPISKPVVKLSLNGEFLEKYSSVKLAGEYNNCKSNSVSACCLGKRHQLKGYIYRYLEDYEKGTINITTGKNSKKVVLRLDPITEEILEIYNSAAETKFDGFNPINVSQVCRGEKKTHLKYKWKYEE